MMSYLYTNMMTLYEIYFSLSLSEMESCGLCLTICYRINMLHVVKTITESLLSLLVTMWLAQSIHI